MSVNIEESWKTVLQEEFDKPYFRELKEFIKAEKSGGRIIYPAGSNIFAAFDHTPFDKVKVVILGQDPYHGPGQANGLCFSVSPGVRVPPSLQNIFKELKDDLDLPIPANGDLRAWAMQGVLLLNATMTVRQGEPGSHQNKGWETFTDRVISLLSEKRENLVFLLWGKFAQSKELLIDHNKHLVLKSHHPSPFSADRGFFGCRHFSKANQYLVQHNIPAVNWQLC
jgi:uracil-DNA glycosylase